MKYILTVLLLISLQNSAKAPSPIKVKEFIIFMPPVERVINKKEQIIKDLSVLHPAFRNKVVKLLYEAKKQGIELAIVETYRNPERQDYLKGRGFSMLHGSKSKHQHYIAVDLVPVEYGEYTWDNKDLWNKIGQIGENLGLKWGGRWRKLYDPGHFEYPISIDSISFIPMPKITIIPLHYKK